MKFTAVIHLLVAFFAFASALVSPVRTEETSLAISGAAAPVQDAHKFGDVKERNVGNTANLHLAPIEVTVTYIYNCPSGPLTKFEAFGFLVQWLSAERRVSYRPLQDTAEKVMAVTMHGTYPYWSTAIFEHRTCVVAGGHACSYFYNGQIVVRIAEKLTGQGVWKWGLGYQDPVITRNCVPGNRCKDGKFEVCTVTDVY